ncbi:MAG: metallopeptidase [Clostridia bacterium]|nr:metallopeptidase [Clostridia bacterium]
MAETLAGEILRSTVTSLLLNLRFLESALFRLNPTPEETTFATNGEQLFYGFEFLFTTYRRDPAELMRGYLHVLMHCIFRHPFVNMTVDRELWDLACDIACEASIEELSLRQLQTERGRTVHALLKNLKKKGLRLTAEKLYHHFMSHPGRRQEFLEMAPDFHFCDHTPWYEQPQRQTDDQPNAEAGKGDGSGRNDSEPDTEQEKDGGSSRSDSQPDAQNSQDNQSSGEQNSGAASRQKLIEQWEGVSRHIQMALEAFGRQAGDEAGNLVQELRALNREHYDYRSFLQRFAVLHEVMKLSPDEFDYIFYTYGLELYGNVPLIEPLEYREERRIREFAIIIDTSGSTSGDLVQMFLQKTFNILKSTETFASRISLRIIQCDAKVQESVLVHTQEEFDAYIKSFRIRGQGGTDFRPAFAHVDDLVRSGELRRLKGLIYFTDGYGTFPARKPDYDAAFVFVRENDYDEPPAVPPWAIKLVLDKEEVASI